ncbi:MAG: DKNYY domain-containing protein [Gammaproteobacteria bacterium]|nr:DKNYY domain-containing protein [Gammaproteobacteria bacterium]MDH5730157.1 DKNYY domain-containing protein [Gammaproteobacteria bacterium]
MQLAINIIVTVIISPWFLLFMMSPMMFDAPGSENDKSHIISTMLLLCYPIGVFVLLKLFGWQYFGVNSTKLIIVSAVVIMLGFFMFGYVNILSNAMKGVANSGYSVANGKVYYDARPIDEADSQSFTLFEEDNNFHRAKYARDTRHLYYEGKKIEGVEDVEIERLGDRYNDYWKNNSQIIYDGEILKGARPEYFSIFNDYDSWSQSDNPDGCIVYHFGKALSTVDKSSFKVLNQFLAKDKDNIYERTTKILSEADAATFSLYGDDHAFGKDKDHVYYLSTKTPFVVEGADVASFKHLERGYAQDKDSVYHILQYQTVEKIQQADATTFETTRYDEKTKSEARDKNYYYYDGKIVGNR